jgi:hypothetical protein
MNRCWIAIASLIAYLLGPLKSSAAIVPVLAPLTTFGGGDGYVAPGERTYLTTDSAQRGLAYNPATGHLLLVTRTPALGIRILDGASGADLGTMNTSGITASGAIFALNMIAADAAGFIYACNLADTSTAAFRIYEWQNESSPPLGAYANTPLAGARLGDSFDVIGTAPNARIVAGYGASPVVAGNNGYAVFTTTGGPPYSASHIAFAGTPPDAGDFRLGVTFLNDENTVAGSQGHNVFRLTSYAGSTGSLLASPSSTTSGERPMDYAVVGGTPLLATLDTDTSVVRVYDATNAAAPQLLDSLTNIGGPGNANANHVGQVRWGAAVGNTAALYVLNTNNGIQAFNVTIPEPGPISLSGLAALALLRVRRRA